MNKSITYNVMVGAVGCFIAELPNCRIVKLSNCRIAELSNLKRLSHSNIYSTSLLSKRQVNPSPDIFFGKQ